MENQPTEQKHCKCCICTGAKKGPRGKYGSKFATEEERIEANKASKRRYYYKKKAEREISREKVE